MKTVTRPGCACSTSNRSLRSASTMMSWLIASWMLRPLHYV